MLFHPKDPRKILGITFHGIFPKRQRQFAVKLGKLVSDELLSFSDIESKITDEKNLDRIMPVIDAHLDNFLKVKLADAMPLVSMFIGEKTINQLKEVFMNEMKTLFPVIMSNYMDELKNDLDLEKMVVNRVSSFSSGKLESVLNQILKKEFRFVEIIGGVLGCIIGILQVVISLLTL